MLPAKCFTCSGQVTLRSVYAYQSLFTLPVSVNQPPIEVITQRTGVLLGSLCCQLLSCFVLLVGCLFKQLHVPPALSWWSDAEPSPHTHTQTNKLVYREEHVSYDRKGWPLHCMTGVWGWGFSVFVCSPGCSLFYKKKYCHCDRQQMIWSRQEEERGTVFS